MDVDTCVNVQNIVLFAQINLLNMTPELLHLETTETSALLEKAVRTGDFSQEDLQACSDEDLAVLDLLLRERNSASDVTAENYGEVKVLTTLQFSLLNETERRAQNGVLNGQRKGIGERVLDLLSDQD